MANVWLILLGACVAVAGAAVSSTQPKSSSLTCKQIQAAANDLRKEIRSSQAKDEDERKYKPLIGGFVRLAFHMCTGGQCKGCINVDDPSNIHLDQYVSVLEKLYVRKHEEFSRGDFWALAAIVALQESEKLTNKALNRAFTFMRDGLTFRFGRADCSPSSPFTSELHTFPDASRGVDHVIKFFADNFGFSDEEAVILLGAHKLGGLRNPRTHLIFRQWVSPTDTLTNEYYTNLMNDSNGWTQANLAPCPNCPPVTMFQNARGKRLMLNVDISIRKNLTFANGLGGQATCTLSTCPNSATLPSVIEYADSDAAWQLDFATTFMKMIETGYPAGQLKDPISCATKADALKELAEDGGDK